MTDEITPARLRELADTQDKVDVALDRMWNELNAILATLREDESRAHAAVNAIKHGIGALPRGETAAALRAAADRPEEDAEKIRVLRIGISNREKLIAEHDATLAARDALLRRAMAREKFIRGISPSVAAMFDEHDAPLAAEIAAALGGTDV